MNAMILPSGWVTLGLAVVYVMKKLWTRQYAKLDSIPGPWLARKTKLWMVQQQRGLNRQWADIAIHEKYGPVVRIAPNEVMVSSPSAFRAIYGPGHDFKKGEWYQGLGNQAWGGPETFNLLIEEDLNKYRLQRKLIGPAYTSTVMKQIESEIDGIILAQIKVMKERANRAVDIELLFTKFISDCIAQMTFSKHNNLLRNDKDDGSIGYVLDFWNYGFISGYFPTFHYMLMGFRHYASYVKGLIRYFFPNYVHSKELKSKKVPQNHPWTFLTSQVTHYFGLRSSLSSEENSPSNIINRLLLIQQEKPTLLDGWVASACATNFGAGVETTSITITALLYHVLSNEGCQDGIYNEVNLARKAGRLSTPPKLSEVKDLKYFNACLNESMRLHHVIGMPLARVVPRDGLELEGCHLPPGTIVSMDPWVLNRSKVLYGEDAHIWRPERWLEYSPERMRYLSAYNFSFGSGLRSCPGKHLAEALYYKILPTLFGEFDLALAQPNVAPTIVSRFTVRFRGLMGSWTLRDEVEE